MQVLAHVGIALATALSAWLNCWLLARGLKARGMFDADARLKRRCAGAAAASLVMGAALVLAEHQVPGLLAAPGLTRWLALGGLVLLGLVAFAIAATALGALHPREFLRTLRRPAS